MDISATNGTAAAHTVDSIGTISAETPVSARDKYDADSQLIFTSTSDT